MIYLYEPLFTFFFILSTSNQTDENALLSIIVFCNFLILYSISKKNYYNLTIALSFLITGYRPITEVLLCIALQLFGTFAASLLMIAADLQLPKYENPYTFGGLFLLEFFAAFILTLVYYCLFVDLRNSKEKGGVFAVASMFGAIAVSFPSLCNGNVLKMFAGMNEDLELVGATFLGQVFGSLFAGVFYKFVICENQSLKMKEIDVTDNNDVNINF